jgi:predicted hexulose-6-phosphate isomerase
MGAFSLGLYEKSMPDSLTLQEKMLEARNAGFDFLEISIDETESKLSRLKWDRQVRHELVQAMWATGIHAYTLCLSGHRKYPLGSEDADVRQMGMEIMSDAIDFAFDLGVRIIQLAGYDVYYQSSNETTRRIFLDNLQVSVELAARKGMILAFETMETEFMNTVEKAMAYVDRVNSPYLQVYPDLGNLANAALSNGSNCFDDLEKGRGHIVAMHLKETVPGVFREIPFGTGHVDFTKGIQKARDMGVRIFVGEFWHAGNRDWKDQLIRANSFLRSRFA